MNLLIVTANRSEIEKHLHQLKLLNFKVDVVVSMEEAGKILSRKKTNVALLSWGLKDEDVLSAFRTISVDHNVPCLIFSEDRSRKATNQLLTSGTRNVIYPPLSAHGVERRIQLLFRAIQNQSDAKEKAGSVPSAAESRKRRKQALQKAITDSLASLKDKNFPKASQDTKSHLLIRHLQWHDSQGYFLAACDRPDGGVELLEAVQSACIEQLQNRGEAQGAAGFLDVDLGFKTLKKWVTLRAECIVPAKVDKLDLVFAFADTDSLPSYGPSIDPGFVWVDVNRWLTARTKIPFDIFVHLPENHKFVHYIRKDATISEQDILRLGKVGHDRCFVKPSDCDLLFKHLLTHPEIHPSVTGML